MRNDPGIRRGFVNAQWTLGANDLIDAIEIFGEYNLQSVAEKIRYDVLILAGEKDYFVPVEQVYQFERGLTSARSVTTRVFTEDEGKHEHCRLGAANLFHGALFDWIAEKFAGDVAASTGGLVHLRGMAGFTHSFPSGRLAEPPLHLPA